MGRELARDGPRDKGLVEARDVERDGAFELAREDCCDSLRTVALDGVRLDVARDVKPERLRCRPAKSLTGELDLELCLELACELKRELDLELTALRTGIFESESRREMLPEADSEGTNGNGAVGLCGVLESLLGVPMIGDKVLGFAILLRGVRGVFTALTEGATDCRRCMFGLFVAKRDFRRFDCGVSEDLRKLKSDVVTELRLELRRSDTVCVELLRSGEVELDLLRAFTLNGVNVGLLLLPNEISSMLAQLERSGIRDMLSALLITRSNPFCLRVGFRFGLSDRGNAPGGITTDSRLRSSEERFSRGMAVRYGSVISGNVSQLFIFGPYARAEEGSAFGGYRSFGGSG